MSLFDALLEDSLADSLLNPEASSKEIFIAIRSDGAAGTGTLDDPFDGIMKRLSDSGGQTVHLGPGVFLTEGSTKGSWRPRYGQRIVGSGLYATTLRLQSDSLLANWRGYYVFDQTGTALQGYEISD